MKVLSWYSGAGYHEAWLWVELGGLIGGWVPPGWSVVFLGLSELYHLVLFFRVGHVFAAAPAFSVFGWLYGLCFFFFGRCAVWPSSGLKLCFIYKAGRKPVSW